MPLEEALAGSFVPTETVSLLSQAFPLVYSEDTRTKGHSTLALGSPVRALGSLGPHRIGGRREIQGVRALDGACIILTWSLGLDSGRPSIESVLQTSTLALRFTLGRPFSDGTSQIPFILMPPGPHPPP